MSVGGANVRQLGAEIPGGRALVHDDMIARGPERRARVAALARAWFRYHLSK